MRFPWRSGEKHGPMRQSITPPTIHPSTTTTTTVTTATTPLPSLALIPSRTTDAPIHEPCTYCVAPHDIESVSGRDGKEASAVVNVSAKTTTPASSPAKSTSPSKSAAPTGDVYDRFTAGRKLVIVSLLSFCALQAPMSSTTILAATPEVAKTYHTTGTILNASNAVYLVMMGLSPVVWGPMSQVYGRRNICLITSLIFLVCSAGTAAAPDLASFYIFRLLTAFGGTAFLTVGGSCIGDIYRPSERATAMAWFFCGALVGPAIGPFIGGLIVTFTTWRVTFAVQSALALLATTGTYFLLPETIHHRKSTDLVDLPRKKKARVLWSMVNPWRVVRMLRYPNLLVMATCSSSLVWNMYSLLTPIRYVLNPRFNLDSPLLSGLFFLAPGFGMVTGTFFGGRYADYVLNREAAKRARSGGQSVPEDRLWSALPFLLVATPGCMLVYGWTVEKRVGGIALPVIAMFAQGVCQLMCFPSINTYCVDVQQSRSAESLGANYMSRYFVAAIGSAVVLPAVDVMGIGWFSTISAAFMAVSGLALWAAILFGQRWRNWIDGIDGRNQAGGAGSNDSRARGDFPEKGAACASTCETTPKGTREHV